MIIHEAVDISGVGEGQTVYCEFQVCPLTITQIIDHPVVMQLGGSSHQPLGTDEVIPLEDGRARLCHINKNCRVIIILCYITGLILRGHLRRPAQCQH